MTHPPAPVRVEAGQTRIIWPDRSHRTAAEAWGLTPDEIAAEHQQHVEPKRRDWRRV